MSEPLIVPKFLPLSQASLADRKNAFDVQYPEAERFHPEIYAAVWAEEGQYKLTEAPEADQIQARIDALPESVKAQIRDAAASLYEVKA